MIAGKNRCNAGTVHHVKYNNILRSASLLKVSHAAVREREEVRMEGWKGYVTRRFFTPQPINKPAGCLGVFGQFAIEYIRVTLFSFCGSRLCFILS